jgi:alpha-1,2-mannosyltransferase
VADRRPAAWLMAAVALFLLAVAGYALLVHAFPQSYWMQIDTAVYRDGGIAVRNQPAMLYALELGPAKLPFTYTPFAALLFAVGSGASFATWQVGLAVLTVGLLPVVAYLSLGLAGRPAGLARAAAAFAIAAVGLWLEPVATTLFFGQINLVLLALVVGDLALPDRIKGKGIGIGLAAGIKLTPLIFIPYLLFTRRVRAAAVSALTFAVTAGLGFALLPHASAVYWGGQLTRPGRKSFHLLNQSLNGVILRLAHAGPEAHAYWLVAAVIVGIAGLAVSILASRRGHELLGLVACAATGLLLSPVSWSHHYVYVVPALVLAAYGPRRLGYRILAAALVVGLFGWWPVPIGNQGGYGPKGQLLPRGLLLLAPNRGNNPAAVEFTWRGLELIVGNYYVLTLLVFIAATACALVIRPTSSGTGGTPHKVELVGDVDQLARVQLPAAHGQPVGQVRRFHPILAIPQRVLDRVKDAAQEVSLVSRVVPVRAGVDDPVRRPGR